MSTHTTHTTSTTSAPTDDIDQEAVRRARGRVAENITDLIGHTPMVRLRSFDKHLANIEIWAKCEFMNPGGSVKDRAAYQMIKDAIASGALTKDREIIDSSSGNTGIAYSLIGGALGYRVALVLPGNVSWARRKISEAFGTRLIFSSPMEGSDGAIYLCRKLVEESPDRYFYPNQYGNPSNPRGHYESTGREIIEQTDGRVTHFVTGIGTSGTVMGTGRRLKDYRADIEVYAVEPDDALHGLEGLKHMESSLVPEIYQPEQLDGILPVSTEEAWEVCERLSREEGILVGHSSGAAVAGAVRIARRLTEAGRPGVIVTVFPDRADRYFEAPLPTQTSPSPVPGPGSGGGDKETA
jgi:S-sulfo-L-cysteine synthase (O-acetyl-L-serine-dependent)